MFSYFYEINLMEFSKRSYISDSLITNTVLYDLLIEFSIFQVTLHQSILLIH